MLKRSTIAVLFIVLSLVIIPSIATARKGVGIIWFEQSAIVQQGTEYCLTYGVYNPWDEGVNAALSVSSEFNDILTSEHAQVQYVAPGTLHGDAIPIQTCFEVPVIYPEQCLAGPFLCEQTCQVDEKLYEGEVIVSEQKDESSGGGSAGSATSMGVAAPLKIKVACTPHPRDWTPLYIFLIVVVLLAISIVLYRRFRTPPLEREKRKLQALQEKIARMKKGKR